MTVEWAALRDWQRLFGLLLTDSSPDRGYAMSYTMEDFNRDFVKERLSRLTPEEQEEVLQSLPPERRLAGLSAEQIRQYLDRLTAGRAGAPRQLKRKK